MAKDNYEKPIIEVITFFLVESITSSMDYGAGTICTEEIG